MFIGEYFFFLSFINFKAFENNCMLPLGSSIKKQSWCLYLTTLIILNFIIDPDVFSCCHRPARNTNIQILPNSKLSLKKKKKSDLVQSLHELLNQFRSINFIFHILRQSFSIWHALKRWFTMQISERETQAFFLGASISHSRTHLYRWKLSPQVFVINFSMGYISNKILWMRCHKFSFLCDWLDTNPAGPELRTHCPILFFFFGLNPHCSTCSHKEKNVSFELELAFKWILKFFREIIFSCCVSIYIYIYILCPWKLALLSLDKYLNG